MSTDVLRQYARGAIRLLTLVFLLSLARVESVFIARKTLQERCRWRQRWCRLLLGALGIPLKVSGLVPRHGMVVSNHVTYLDILTFGAVFEGVLVSKVEVRNWPLIGPLTAAAGTLYVDRGSARSAAEATRAMARLLGEGTPVLVFPEGTTSDGSGVLPFQAPLFEAAVRSGARIWPAAIHYQADDHLEAIPYWGEMTLAPHLARVMRIPGLAATITVAEGPVQASNRRGAACEAYGAVQALHVRYASTRHALECTGNASAMTVA